VATVDAEGAEASLEGRPQRADAVRNRQRILDAAEEVFAVQGASAPVDVVAERAGVGVGTLYRHFPTKEALIEAVVESRLEALADEVTAEAESSDPGQAFFAFLHRFALQAATKRDLFDSLGSAGVDLKARCAVTFTQLEEGFSRLLERSVAAGAVRPDVTATEVIGLVAGTCMAVNAPVALDPSFDRMVDVVCDGLRPQTVR
jgi:AcrR family transcriptional regulator